MHLQLQDIHITLGRAGNTDLIHLESLGWFWSPILICSTPVLGRQFNAKMRLAIETKGLSLMAGDREAWSSYS